MSIIDKIFKKNKQKKEKEEKVEKVEEEKKEPVKQDMEKKEAPKKSEKSEQEKKNVPRKEDTGDSYKVLIKPVLTEKTTALGENFKYVFKVGINANKVMVKKAIKSVYGVEPVKVNIVRVSGKRVRTGRIRGRTSDWKKAIVTLKKGDKIEVFEGV